MSVLSGISSFFRGGPTYTAGIRNLAQQSLRELPPPELYAVLRALYANNSFYDQLTRMAHDRNVWQPPMKPLYSPCYRTVEFHASKLLTGELEIETENQAIVDPIKQLWQWSNFDQRKTTMARLLAMLGDLFLKVAMRPDGSRVYFELIDPAHVVDFDTDERCYLTWIRIEVPMTERDANGKVSSYLHVEVWDKALGLYRRWKVDDPRLLLQPVDQPADISALGPPNEEIELSAFGIDFLPIVHARFRDVDEPRGVAAILPAYDKINELNMMATRLHQMLYRHNRPVFAIESAGRDPSGRPIPPPVISGATNDGSTAEGDEVTLGDDTLLRLPAGWTLSSLVPTVQYDAGLRILQDQLSEIEKDLPELSYYRLREISQISGRAARIMLSDAEDRALEARGNLEAALVRAQQMGLTIGAAAGLFKNLGGTYEDGSLDHRFKARPVFNTSEFEDAQGELALAQSFTAWRAAGLPMTESLERVGYTEEQALELVNLAASDVTTQPVQPATDAVPQGVSQ